LPVVIHTRPRAEADTFDALRGFGGTVVPALLLVARPGGRVAWRRGLRSASFAGKRHLPEVAARPASVPPKQIPEELLMVETRRPVPVAPSPCAAKPERARQRHAPRRAFVAELRGLEYDELDSLVERNDAVARSSAGEQAVEACAGSREFGVPAQPRAGPELPDRRQTSCA